MCSESEYGRAVAVLVRMFGDIDLAEDAVQDAFTMPWRTGPPVGYRRRQPAGSSLRRATGAIDRLRRESSLGRPPRPGDVAAW